MLCVTGSKNDLTWVENANRNSGFLCQLLSIVGFDAQVVPCVIKRVGIKVDAFAVNIKIFAKQADIERIGRQIKELCVTYDQDSMVSIITESSAEPRIYTVLYDEEEGWYPGFVGTLGYSPVEPPDSVKDWVEYKGKYFGSAGEFRGFDPVQDKDAE